jgi:hypothetical protein
MLKILKARSGTNVHVPRFSKGAERLFGPNRQLWRCEFPTALTKYMESLMLNTVVDLPLPERFSQPNHKSTPGPENAPTQKCGGNLPSAG